MNIQTPIPSNYGYFKEKYAAQWEQVADALKAQYGESILETLKVGVDKVDMLTLKVKKEIAHAFLGTLKEQHKFTFLTDMTATDEEVDPRFLLVFHLMNMETRCRVRVKVPLSENEKIATFIPLWEGANWAEREVFDMFGIQFEGHPDLRRILMDIRWEGHPLRKDYPLRGYQVFLTPEPIDPELLK